MYGRQRVRKKHLAKAGWQVVADSRIDKNHRLVFRKAGGEEVTVEAASRPRAFAKAARELR